MATLVFDITTIGHEWSSLDALTRIQLSRFQTAEEAEAQLGLSPLTSQISHIALYDVERRQRMVYTIAGERREGVKIRDEKELLEEFWSGALNYNVFVTYGGTRFDVPFLLLRSLVHDVTPTIEFPAERSVRKQSTPYHVDIKEQLTLNASFRALPLHQLCMAMGVESPDSLELSGEAVGEFFREEKFTDLITYAEGNVDAIAAIYDRWFTHLSPQAFKNLLL